MKLFLEKYYGFIPVLLLCIFYTWKAVGFPAHDFSNYYFGGRFLADGHFASSIYFPYEFNKAIAASGHHGIFANYAPNTPFLALVFYPLSFLSLAAAKLVFNLISVLLFVYSLFRLVSFYKINPAFLLLIPVLFLVPVKNELLFGQVYFLLFFLLSESWLAYEKNQLKKMAVFLSLAIMLKVFPVFLILIFLFKKQFRPFVYVMVGCLVLALISIVFSGFDVWIFYLQNVLTKASGGEISGAYVANYQSVFMFLKQLLIFDATENPDAVFNSPVLFSALITAFKVLLIAIGIYVSKKIPDTLLIFGYWIFAIILISPYGSTYTFILMLFPFFALLKSDISVWKKTFVAVLLFLVNNLPLSLFEHKFFPFSYLRLLFLLLLLAVLLWAIHKSINWKMVTLAFVIPMVLVLFFKNPEFPNSHSVLGKNAPILVYDYKIADNRLTYFYWDENGGNTKSIALKSAGTTVAEINENQVYYNKKQLTFDNSHKRKPMIINHKTLIYLSDFDKGIGFYALRKIDLN